jgi:hypothetical protein
LLGPFSYHRLSHCSRALKSAQTVEDLNLVIPITKEAGQEGRQGAREGEREGAREGVPEKEREGRRERAAGKLVRSIPHSEMLRTGLKPSASDTQLVHATI